MDVIKNSQIKGLRQSKYWSEYLQTIGWKTKKVGENFIQFKKIPFGNVAKLQRPSELSKKDLEKIDEICEKEKVLYLKLELKPNQDTKILKERGFVKSFFPLLSTTTLIINLRRKEEDLWKEVSRSGKYSTKRAQREGSKVEIIREPNQDVVEKFYKTYKESNIRQKTPSLNLKELQSISKIFGKKAFIAFVTKDGTVMGVKFYLEYKDNIWYLYGGTSNLGRDGKWGYDLVWQSMLYFKSKGYDRLDLEGITDDRFPNIAKNWGGFSHFKEKFGGEKIVFPHPYIKVYSKILKFLSKFYPVLPL